MIKIIKEGKLPTKIYKTVFTTKCTKCGCEFEFEREDFDKVERCIAGNYYITCSYCNYEIAGKYEYFKPHIIEVDNDGE